MLDRIIVAFDGSDLSREAFAYSKMLAEASGAQILALHVLEPTPPPVMGESLAPYDPGPAMGEYWAEADAQREEETAWAQRELAEMQSLCEKWNVRCEKQIVNGRLIPTLVDIAQANDLIAIGMKGRFARGGLGSTTKSLVYKSPCPVMVVSGSLRPVNRALGVFDGTSVSKRAVAFAKDLSEQANWPLTLLAVGGEYLPLDDALDRAQRLAPEAQVLTYGPEGKSEADQIEQAASHAGYGLLIMGAYPDSWLHQLLFGFGGTTAHVLSHVGAPVVLVH